MRTAIAICVALTALTALPATASDDESYDMWEMRKVMQAEIARAREQGGYSDPITAIMRALNGTATERDVVPAYSDIYDLPGREAEPVNRTAPLNR